MSDVTCRKCDICSVEAKGEALKDWERITVEENLQPDPTERPVMNVEQADICPTCKKQPLAALATTIWGA